MATENTAPKMMAGELVKDPIQIRKIEEEIKKKKDFEIVVAELQKLGKLDKAELKVTGVYNYDATTENNGIFVNQLVTLEVSDHTASIEFFKFEGAEVSGEYFNGQIVSDRVITGINVNDNRVKLVFAKEAEVAQISPLELEKAPVIENYKPGIFNEMIGTEAWNEFCFDWEAGGVEYNHCGKQCGNWGKYGGGSMVNRIDSCCYMHDYCYKYDQQSEACCDEDLVYCAYNNRSSDPWMYQQINAYYGWAAAVCRK